MTEWKVLPEAPCYEVSDDGRVRSCARGAWRELKAFPDTSGYPAFRLGKGVGTRRASVLVARVFLGPRPEGAEVRHLNGDRTDNRAENLAYGSRSQNSRDAVKHGTHQGFKNRGERSGKAKLTEGDVRQILVLYKFGCSPAQLAQQFGVTASNISAIVTGRSWKHLRGIRLPHGGAE